MAAGLIEAAMKRLLLLLTDRRSEGFSSVDHNWTDLEAKLRGLCDGSDEPRRVELLAALDWAVEKRIKIIRDDVVHAQWWPFAGVGVRRNRFYRRTDGATLLGSIEDLHASYATFVEYERRLDALLAEDWPFAVLYRLPDSPLEDDDNPE